MFHVMSYQIIKEYFKKLQWTVLRDVSHKREINKMNTNCVNSIQLFYRLYVMREIIVLIDYLQFLTRKKI